MAILKCKMCGGDIEVNADKTFGTCDSCGSTMTLPRIDDERRANAFNRANHFRRLNDFDKAIGAYEHILSEDDTDAEAHWGVALARYGIEYVEDPNTHKRIPTCHRVHMDSILADADYLAALEYAPDGYARSLYEQEAKRIAEIQKEILAISSREEPYDVFICYKEKTDSGTRTKDSAIAQDIYYQLTNEGYTVFFSRITLEDKLGQAYEPYIFAALNSAKVMIAIGTCMEHFNAVWVRNEWSRYLDLMKTDRSKLLIPCYRDMDPYDLPEELSMLQSQDMAKIGFMQDLIRGVRKVVDASKAKPAAVASDKADVKMAVPGVVSLCERGALFLEDGDWQNADAYFDRALDIDPKYAPAYVGKLCAELRVHMQDDLPNCDEPFDENGSYRKALRFGDAALQAELRSAVEHIKARKEENRLHGLYGAAIEMMGAAAGGVGFTAAAERFERISGYRDADERARTCRKRAAEYRAEQERKAEQERIERERKAEQERIERERKAEQERIAAEIQERKTKKTMAIVLPLIVAVIGFVLLVTMVIMPARHYKRGEELLAAGDYNGAAAAFAEAGDIKRARATCDFNNMLSSISHHTVGLRADGAVLAVGNNSNDECAVQDWRDIVAVSAGNNHTAGLRADSTVVAVGYNGDGQCDVQYWRDIVAVSAGGSHTAGLRSDGTVVAVGRKAEGQCDVRGWRDIVAISAGGYHTVGLRADGSVVASGSNRLGQCNLQTWCNIVAISAGGSHTVGLQADGSVVAVGQNEENQCNVRDWRDIVAVSAGSYHTVGLRSDGTVVAVGRNGFGQCNVRGWRDTVAVSAGWSHTVGLQADGTVVAVGSNDYGQCNVQDWKLW